MSNPAHTLPSSSGTDITSAPKHSATSNLSAISAPSAVSDLPIESGIEVGLSLVIPTYNERDTIASLLKSVCQILNNSIAVSYEVWVVDDDSPDGTWAIAQQLATDHPQIQVLRRQHMRGLASAAVAGWQRSRGQYLALMDGDLQHPPEVLQELLRAMEAGADLAIASRHVGDGEIEGWSRWRKIASWGARALGWLILPKIIGQVQDPMSGYFMVRQQAIAHCHLQPIGYKVLLEVLVKGNIQTIEEVGYCFQNRQGGKSKVGLIHYWDYIRHLVRLRLSS